MLQMHQRIVALEAQREEDKVKIAQLTSIVNFESCKEYDATDDSFSDGCSIDWFTWEPLNTMHILHESRSAYV